MKTTGTFATALVATLSLASTVTASNDDTLVIPLQKRQTSIPITLPDGLVDFTALNVSSF